MYKFLWIFGFLLSLSATAKNPLVVDSVTGAPLPGAPIFNSSGALIGTASDDGTLPHLLSSDYPVTVKYMGYRDYTCVQPGDSLILMTESSYTLPEVVADSKDNSILHLLGFVRDHSTLATYTDTVTLFREKWVDFMIPGSKVKRFRGWLNPRVLTAKSYYRFTDYDGLDSVSDRSNHHFSWSDWVNIVEKISLPARLNHRSGTDTVFGRFNPSEVWTKSDDRLRIRVNVLSDTANRKWVPALGWFFKNGIDFEKFNISYDFRDVVSDQATSRELTHITCNIQSRGRGRNMFGFNRRDEDYFVTTYTELYIVDQEYLTVADAKRWERHNLKSFDPVLPPGIVPEISEQTATLIARVDSIDHDDRRIHIKPDPRIGYRKERPKLPKNKILRFFRKMLG